MAGRLQGKVAIVSGAGCVGPGWGNGRAMAVIFAQEGAKVFAADRSLDAMTETLARVREAGGEIEPHQCDATDSAQVAKMIAACRARFGRIDILSMWAARLPAVAELSEKAGTRRWTPISTVFRLQARSGDGGRAAARSSISRRPPARRGLRPGRLRGVEASCAAFARHRRNTPPRASG
jgi:NAD(P)-dependent dehydrogenase (short-subunit alcohol dehydrogenase family)